MFSGGVVLNKESVRGDTPLGILEASESRETVRFYRGKHVRTLYLSLGNITYIGCTTDQLEEDGSES